MTTPSQITSPTSSAGTPEEYFQPHPNPEKDIPIDALLFALSRAQAVLALIQCDGSEENRFMLNHSMIIEALWCVEGLLEQSEAMVRHSIESKVVA